ncbi:UDP-glucose 4-epimerase GalE [Roseobacter sp. HKCCA0434]|uniref:UDP-glucose 4-epimerase GalE n=1 Tax=Roseobacter sp. HKCCA0434 TaxID=3079297 RepID=UPI002905C844|nr:UDP-glucose 4-epimerase GalE [Roseobacter sp. HKCCA0434]
MSRLDTHRGRVLLTGGAGYIGSHCCVALMQEGYQPVILDNFANARRDVPDRIALAANGPAPQVIEADIRDRTVMETVLAEGGFDAVMHFAGLKSVAESVAHPERYFDINLGGLTVLVAAMAATDTRRLIFSSSATVYDARATGGAISEDAPLGPASPYGHSKLLAEKVLLAQAEADPSWRVGILRYFNPAGAHGTGHIGEEPADPPDNLMPYIAQVASGRRARLQVFGDDYDTPDGTGVRDYIHVADLARGHVASLAALERDGRGHVVNLGTGRGQSVLEMRAAYARVSGREVSFEIRPRRPGDVAQCYCDATRARAVLGFEARHGIDEMCASSWSWTRRREGLA